MVSPDQSAGSIGKSLISSHVKVQNPSFDKIIGSPILRIWIK